MAKLKVSKAEDSPVVQLLDHIFEHSMVGTAHSWGRLNPNLREVLLAAIEMGYKFWPDDFLTIYGRHRGTFWFGRDGADGIGEAFYAKACEVRNLSACQSYEKWRDRPPYILKGTRLTVGSEVRVNIGTADKPVAGHGRVTSIHTDKIIVSTYPNRSFHGKPSRVFKLDKTQLKGMLEHY